MTLKLAPITPYQLLASNSIAILPNLYSLSTIEKWNTLFTPLLNKQSNKRRYINALQLFDLGCLEEIFTTQLQDIIYSIVPDPILYHCHVYEIDGNQEKSHISADNKLNGWHRDVDCKHQLHRKKVQHVSLFIYLSDVEAEGGYFEISDKQLFPPQFGNQDTHYQLTGSTGTSFLFDRKAFHRASPNRSKIARRVLKVSFQSAALFNHKQNEPIFNKVREQLSNNNRFICQLFGKKHNTEDVYQVCDSESLIATLPLTQTTSQFSPLENGVRYVRDLRFIFRRLAANFHLVNDKKVPKAKI